MAIMQRHRNNTKEWLKTTLIVLFTLFNLYTWCSGDIQNPYLTLKYYCWKLTAFKVTYLSLKKSATCLKSAMQYSRFMSMSTLSDPVWTGTWRKEYTLGWRRIFAISCKKRNKIIHQYQIKKVSLQWTKHHLRRFKNRLPWAMPIGKKIKMTFDSKSILNYQAKIKLQE